MNPGDNGSKPGTRIHPTVNAGDSGPFSAIDMPAPLRGPLSGQSAGFFGQIKFLLSKALKLKLRYVVRTHPVISACSF
jgi:hypothetical protein